VWWICVMNVFEYVLCDECVWMFLISINEYVWWICVMLCIWLMVFNWWLLFWWWRWSISTWLSDKMIVHKLVISYWCACLTKKMYMRIWSLDLELYHMYVVVLKQFLCSWFHLLSIYHPFADYAYATCGVDVQVEDAW